MATGRVDVFRRRDSPKYSKRESEYYRNGGGYSVAELSRGGDGGVRCRDDVHNSRRPVENGRVLYREGAAELLPEKKRKFSPIIWDKEEKKARTLTRSGVVADERKVPASDVQSRRDEVSECKPEGAVALLSEKRKSPVAIDREEKKVRIASKNRAVKVAPVISPRATHPSQTGGVASESPASEVQSHRVEVSEAVAEAEAVTEASVADGLVEFSQLEAPADLRTPLCQSEAQRNQREKDQTRISLSRWASDTDSPIVDGSCNSSPESGEIQREDSVGPRSRTSSSDEESNSVREEETGGVDGDASGDRCYSDSEDDEGLPQVEEESPVPRGRHTNMLQGCRSVAEFTKLDGMLGEGTYGVVYRARDKETGEIVAIKKVKMDKSNEGFPITSLREINILLSCHHPSIVGVKEVVHNGDDIFMVMECMDYELKLLTEATKQPFSIGEVKYLVKSLLEGVKYFHDNWILHRDLKTSNILLNEGELKICDFGLSRQYGSPLKPYTSLVVTLWYRAPELLLGQKQYSTAIDMWSVGCIMAELLTKEALFQGKTEVDQLDKIFRTLGTPNETDWPGVSKLPGFKAIQVKQRENLLRKKFSGTCFTGSPMLSASGLDLLTKLLTYDPAKRITVDDALSHDWFKDYPEPRPFKPSPTVHDRYMLLRQCQEKEHLERARRGKH